MAQPAFGDDLTAAWINSPENKRNQAITAAKQQLKN
jgi:hypothetical protein